MPKDRKLEGNIVVRDLSAGKFLVMRRSPLIEGTAVGARTAAATAVFRATARQQHNVVDDNLGAVLLLPGCLVIPGAGLNPAFDVQLGALLHVVANDFRHPLVRGQVVPLGAILPFTGLVLEALGSGQAEVGDRQAAGE